MNSKILIVEDEAKLLEILCDYFSSKENCLLKQATEYRRLS